jgi:LacI family transcriptional regulator
VLYGIEEIATKMGYTTTIACNNYNVEREREQVDNLLSHYIAGFVFGPGGLDKRIIDSIMEEGIPLVTVDRKTTDKRIFSVEIDNFVSFYKAINYLIKRGHKDIYYFTEPIIMGTLRDRFEGYKKALIDNDIKFDKNKVFIDKSLQTTRAEGGYEIMSNILKSGHKPQAVISTSDSIVIGAMKATIDLGYKIPEDISFMGNNNSYLSKFMNPSLTTIRQPKKDLGRIAMKLLIDLINGNEPEKKRVFLETSIIERESVGIRLIKNNKYLEAKHLKTIAAKL